jgi:hypothetical protein
MLEALDGGSNGGMLLHSQPDKLRPPKASTAQENGHLHQEDGTETGVLDCIIVGELRRGTAPRGWRYWAFQVAASLPAVVLPLECLEV